MLVWQAHRSKIPSLSFSADGRFLASATGGTRNVHIWDAATGNLVHKLTGNWPGEYDHGTVSSVAFSPNAPLLAAAMSRGVALWRVETWESFPALLCDQPHEIAFGHGDPPPLAASTATHVWLWANPWLPAEIGRAPDHRIPTGGNVASLHYSPNGEFLAMSTRLRVTLWRAAEHRLVRIVSHRNLGNGDTGNRGQVRFSPDSRRLAMAYGRWVEVHSVEDESRPSVKIEAGSGKPGTVWAVSWARDGSTLLTVASDGLVRMWDSNTGTELNTYDWHIGKLFCAAFSPDGLTCAAGGDKGQIVVWDVEE